MGAKDASCDFQCMALRRRLPGPHDVVIDIKYCGVCHSDLHTAAGHVETLLGKTMYPCVPGHEIAGIVASVGSRVTKFTVGDRVGVGCIVDSCLKCANCLQGRENYCSRDYIGTYQGRDDFGRAAVFPAKSRTLGGYSDNYVVHEHFVIKVPTEYPLECAGPVFCAGITMYSPLKRWGAGPGTRVGIVGLGGLGVMGVKLARALGCEVTVISRNLSKVSYARDDLCADRYIVSAASSASSAPVTNQQQQPHIRENISGSNKFVVLTKAEAKGTLDLILNTVPVFHDYTEYNGLLQLDQRKDDDTQRRIIGRQVILGLHEGLIAGYVMNTVTFGRSVVVHSAMGGIQETQECIDLCARPPAEFSQRKKSMSAKQNGASLTLSLCDDENASPSSSRDNCLADAQRKNMILPEIEIVSVAQLNSVFESLDRSNDKGIRYVLDIANTLPQQHRANSKPSAKGAPAISSVPTVQQTLGRPPAIQPTKSLSKPRGVLEAARLIFTPSSGVWYNKHKL